MPKRIVIVGDISERPDRSSVLRALSERAPAEKWEWVQAEGAQFNLPPKYFRPILAALQQQKTDGTNGIRVVKLFHLHGRDQNQLYGAYKDPVEPPHNIETADALVEWLLSEDAGLSESRPWTACECAASLIAVLSKLIKNKSFNKDQHGHSWTKEDDLLGQAPVYRPDDNRLFACAEAVLINPLFLNKGGKQGTTAKEWCINTKYLPAVKKAVTERSLAPLRAELDLVALFATIDGDRSEPVSIDATIVCEKVRAICRDTR